MDVFPQDDKEYKSALSEAVWYMSDSQYGHYYYRYEAIDCIKQFVADERCTDEIINHKFGGNTALSKAVKDGHVDVVKILARNAFTDFKSVDNDDKTVLDTAIKKGDENLVELVKQRIQRDTSEREITEIVARR